MNVLTRIILSVATIGAYRMVVTGLEVASPLLSGPAATMQLTDSNSAYVAAQVTSRMFNGSDLFALPLMLALLAVIWYRPLTNLFTYSKKAN